MPYGIDDADWPDFVRMLRDYRAGRLNNKPPGEERPRSAGRGGGLKLGRTTGPVEKGETGQIVKLAGKKGEEKPVGDPFDAFNRFGDLGTDQDVLYARIGRGWEIVQAACDDFDPAAVEDDEDDPVEGEPA